MATKKQLPKVKKKAPAAKKPKEKLKAKRKPILPPASPPILNQSKINTPRKLAEFLAVYMNTGNFTRACKAADIDARTVYRHKESNAEFATAYAEARSIAADVLEGEAFRRAYEGVARPVFSFGQVCGYTQEYSDSLCMFLLKGLKKDIYGDSLKHSGSLEVTETGRAEAIAELASVLAELGINAPPQRSAGDESKNTRVGAIKGATD